MEGQQSKGVLGDRPPCDGFRLMPATARVKDGVEARDLLLAVATGFGRSPALHHCKITIHWGDGAAADTATIRECGELLHIFGSHVFREPGAFGVQLQLCGVHGHVSAVHTRVLVGSRAQRIAATIFRRLTSKPMPDGFLIDLPHELDAIVEALFRNREFLQARAEVLFERIMHRPPHRTETEAIVAQLEQHLPDRVIATELLTTDEYYEKSWTGTIGGFVRAVYLDLLGRERPRARI
jgi:hypothetical protein